jgi:hypothetical protein
VRPTNIRRQWQAKQDAECRVIPRGLCRRAAIEKDPVNLANGKKEMRVMLVADEFQVSPNQLQSSSKIKSIM